MTRRPVATWTGTDDMIDQFARIDNSRGDNSHDLGNGTYAIMLDNMIQLRDERTLGGQVDTRSEHCAGSFIECVAGIAYAHVTKGCVLAERGCGFIEVYPVAARKYLDKVWAELASMGFGPLVPQAQQVTPKPQWVRGWAANKLYKAREPAWWAHKGSRDTVWKEMKTSQQMTNNWFTWFGEMSPAQREDIEGRHQTLTLECRHAMKTRGLRIMSFEMARPYNPFLDSLWFGGSGGRSFAGPPRSTDT